MSKLDQLLKNAYSNMNIQERMYGQFPLEIAQFCGVEEIGDILYKLDDLAIKRRSIEEWDGDSKDAIWRKQKGYSQLLAKLTNKFSSEISEGLSSNEQETRFWVSYTFAISPNAKAAAKLKAYLEEDLPDHYRSQATDALKACQMKQGFISRWFN